jgi:hypothetical protein
MGALMKHDPHAHTQKHIVRIIGGMACAQRQHTNERRMHLVIAWTLEKVAEKKGAKKKKAHKSRKRKKGQ